MEWDNKYKIMVTDIQWGINKFCLIIIVIVTIIISQFLGLWNIKRS